MYFHKIGSQLNFHIWSKLKKAMNYISLMYQITPTCIPCRKCHNQGGDDNNKDCQLLEKLSITVNKKLSFLSLLSYFLRMKWILKVHKNDS